MSHHNLRKVYIETLINLAKDNHNIVSLDTDSREATLADKFASIYPERCFSFGIAEQDMVGSAAGMATMGLIPFVNSYAMFIAMRGLDQVRNIVAYPNFNVKFVLSHYGLDAGSDGVTHQLTEDIAIFRSIPHLKLLQPADANEMKQIIDYAVDVNGPMVIKSGKSESMDVHNSNYKFEYGVPSIISPGDEVAIITNGTMVEHAITAKKTIDKNGSRVKIINMSSLTDINIDALLDYTEGCKHLVTLEDHSIFGGIGGIVSEIMASNRPIKVKRLGLGREFAECGSPRDLYDAYGMSQKDIISAVEDI